MMSYLLQPFIWLSGIGLFLSLLVHIYSFLGQDIPHGQLAMVLHLGIFIVWLPAVLVAQKTTKDFKQKDFWKAALRGCPTWLKRITYISFGYAVINFILFIILESTANGDVSQNIEFRGFSGHWMAFYSAALATLYSATQISKIDKARRCINGHPVTPSAKFCEKCGAPIHTVNIT